jgi:hypothetical protein
MATWSPVRSAAFRPATLAAVFTGLLLVAFFTAALLGTGQYVLAGVISMPVMLALGLAIFVASLGWRHDGIFWTLVISLFIASLVSSFLRQRFTFVATALLLLAVPFVAAAVLKCRRESSHATALIVILVAFYAVGILSTVTGRSGLVPATYTAVLGIKQFVLVGLGAALIWSPRTERGFEGIVRWAWVPFLTLAALQWFAPSIYGAILSDPESTYDRNPFFSQFPRALGPFNHPSVMATMSGVFAVFNVAYVILDRRRFVFGFVAASAYLTVVVMTGQRQELAATLIVLPLVYALARWRPRFGTFVLVASVSLLAVGMLLYAVIPDNIERELQNWGLMSGQIDQSPRSVLYGDSLRLAAQYWPLGTGFGTFASVGSIRFDQSLFMELGYGAFWWFTQRSFLYDSFWSRFIAETGWFGFGLQLLFYIVTLRAIVGWLRDPIVLQDPMLFRRVVLAASGLILVLLISPTSNALSEAHGALFPLIYIGVAWRQIVAARVSPAQVTHQNSPPRRSGAKYLRFPGVA